MISTFSGSISIKTFTFESVPLHESTLTSQQKSYATFVVQYLLPSLSTSANSSNGFLPSFVSFHRLGVKKP
jgi:hypothetical protein